MQWFWLTALTILFSLVVTGHTTTRSQTDSRRLKQQQLEQAEQQLSDSKQQLDRHQTEEKSVLGRLDRLAQRQQQLEAAVRLSTQELQATQEKARLLHQDHARWSQQLQRQRQHLMQRLRQLYKLGQRPYAKLLLTAKDVTDFTRKVQYIRYLATQDKQQLQHYHDQRTRVASAQAELAKAEQQIKSQHQRLRQQQTALNRERQQKTVLLGRIRQDKQLAEQAVAEFTQSVKALTHVIDQLDRARQKAAQQPVKKGQLIWPVNGPILSGYGRVRHPGLDVYTVQKGLYIGSPLGSKISAVAAGTVVYADWFKGLGQLLIIDHGSHLLSLYGHTSELLVKVGDEVQPQQIVATVGNSSTLGKPALYFAIRHNTAPQDPTQWLRQQSARLTQEP